MTAIKLIITDLDGTLVRPDLTISERNLKALQKLKAAGIRVAAVTGRGYDEIIDTLRPAGFDGLGVFDGGAIVIDCATGKELWSKRINTETTLAIIEKLSPHSHRIAYGKGDLTADEAAKRLPTGPVLSVWARLPTSVAEQFAADFEADPTLSAHLTPTESAGPDYLGLHITHIEADKFHGVQAMLEFEHVDREQIAAIGDGHNDRPLFQAAALRFAMGNANDELKLLSNHVVADWMDDGWADMVDQYIL